VTITAAAALAAPLRQFQAWHLRVFCRDCRLLVRLEVDRLVAQQGGKLVGEVVQRLRCRWQTAPRARAGQASSRSRLSRHPRRTRARQFRAAGS